MSLRDLYRYLFDRKRPALNHGGRVISPYKLPLASPDEKLLIEAGIARSPDDARYLMVRHGATAAGVLRIIKRRKRAVTPRERLVSLIRALNGHNPQDAYGKPSRYENPVLPVQYRYRNKQQ